MIEKDTFLDALFGMGGLQQLQNPPKEFTELYEDRFKLRDLDITARVLMHWKEKGLLPEKNDTSSLTENKNQGSTKDKKWKVNRFNFFELVYLFIIQDLREIGFSIEKLINVKKMLLQKFDVLALLEQVSDQDIVEMKKQGFDTTVLEEVLERKQELIDDLPKADKMVTVLDAAIILALVDKKDIKIIVLKDGDVSFDTANTTGQKERNIINLQPHIVLPIFNYFIRFLSFEKYSELHVSYKLLDEQEKLILERVRSGRYKDIKILFNRRNSLTLELTEEVKADNTARLQEILVSGAYQELQVKTVAGMIKYSTLKTREQI